MAERTEIKLQSGTTLHELHDGEGKGFGIIGVERCGCARVWVRTWHDRFAPTHAVFPGFVSAARAVLRGEV